jgi:sugar/nucleoside kinase (ribokinase family)
MRRVRLPVRLHPASDRRFDVVGLGQNSIDLLARVTRFPESNSKQRLEELVWLPGGQVASAMVGCARLGWRACYIGRFGDDDLGVRGRTSLEADGVALAVTIVSGARSRCAVVLVDARTGDRTVLWDRDPRLAGRADDVPEDIVSSGRVLLVDCDDVDESIRAAEVARAHGVVTVIDVEAATAGLDDLLPLIDVIIASEGFPERITGERNRMAALVAMQARYRPALACITLGPSGSIARCGETVIETPAFRIPCLDSTGAGDAFRAGFIAGLLRWGPEDVGQLLRHANAVAGLSCRAHGARDGLPTADEVEALLDEPFVLARAPQTEG